MVHIMLLYFSFNLWQCRFRFWNCLGVNEWVQPNYLIGPYAYIFGRLQLALWPIYFGLLSQLSATPPSVACFSLLSLARVRHVGCDTNHLYNITCFQNANISFFYSFLIFPNYNSTKFRYRVWDFYLRKMFCWDWYSSILEIRV